MGFTTYWTIFGQTNPFPHQGKPVVDKPVSHHSLCWPWLVSLWGLTPSCQLPTNPETSSSPCGERTGEGTCPSVLWGRHYFYPHCNKLNVLSPTKVIRWNLMPNVMVFGDGTFGRWLGHEGKAFMNGISALIKKDPGELPHPFCYLRTLRQTSMNQEAGWLTPNLLTPWSWTFQSPELWEINLCCL